MKKLSNKKLKENNIELQAIDEEYNKFFDWTKYFLSNYGNLLHQDNKGIYKLVTPSEVENGYLSYTLSKPARKYKGKKKGQGKRKHFYAHRMVLMLYCDNPYPPKEYALSDLQGHHKNKDKKDNYYKNLMWACKNKNGRTDHDFLDSIKKIAYYNQENASFYTYKDIELLCKRLKVNHMELIDSIKYNDKLFQEGKWEIYNVNGHFIGLQFYKEDKKKKKNKGNNKKKQNESDYNQFKKVIIIEV